MGCRYPSKSRESVMLVDFFLAKDPSARTSGLTSQFDRKPTEQGAWNETSVTLYKAPLIEQNPSRVG